MAYTRDVRLTSLKRDIPGMITSLLKVAMDLVHKEMHSIMVTLGYFRKKPNELSAPRQSFTLEVITRMKGELASL